VNIAKTPNSQNQIAVKVSANVTGIFFITSLVKGISFPVIAANELNVSILLSRQIKILS
jgi:hypothetical protein